jgi:multiple sugar transport system substrate-binding protein
VPVLQSSWTKQAEILDSPQWRIAHHELDNTAVVRPATPGYREYEDVMRVALRDITAGADVKTQLSRAAQRIDRELQKYRA